MKALVAILISLLAVCALKAANSELSFVYDLTQTGQSSQPLPSWMTSPPSASPSSHANIDFSITPPPGNSYLAVTFYFNEVPGGFLRVYWTGAQTSEMLSDNLYEGIAMPNQHTILIKRSTLSSPGTLTVQSSEANLNLSRIHWEWVDPSTVALASDSSQTAYVDATGKVFQENEVDGGPLYPQADQIQGAVVTASLTNKPERIENGVQFVAPLQAAPQFSRVEVQVAGAPLNQPFQLWVNDKLVGPVSLNVPDLNDPGYETGADGSLIYVGWRKGSIYLPPGLLGSGDNTLQFGIVSGTSSASVTPLAIKNLSLQLNYSAPLPVSSTPVTNQPAVQQPQPSPTPAASQDAKIPSFRFGTGGLRSFDDSSSQP